MSIPYGDPASIRQAAARIRGTSADLVDATRATAGPTALQVSTGAAIERSRDAAVALRERATWIASRLDGTALELDRGADWLEQAQAEAIAAERAAEQAW